jgi:hypothetical protein
MGLKKIKNPNPKTQPASDAITFDALANTLLVQRWRADGKLALDLEFRPYNQEAGQIDWSERVRKLCIENAWEEMVNVPSFAQLAAAQIAVMELFVTKSVLEEELSAIPAVGPVPTRAIGETEEDFAIRMEAYTLSTANTVEAKLAAEKNLADHVTLMQTTTLETLLQ